MKRSVYTTDFFECLKERCRKMSLEIGIQRKPNTTDLRAIKRPEDIYNLEEVQEIKEAIQ